MTAHDPVNRIVRRALERGLLTPSQIAELASEGEDEHTQEGPNHAAFGLGRDGSSEPAAAASVSVSSGPEGPVGWANGDDADQVAFTPPSRSTSRLPLLAGR
jgi:hypothetical protein